MILGFKFFDLLCVRFDQLVSRGLRVVDSFELQLIRSSKRRQDIRGKYNLPVAHSHLGTLLSAEAVHSFTTRLIFC